MVEDLLRVVELIQAAVLAPDAWQPALAAIGQLLGGEQTTLIALSGDGLFASAAGLNDADLGAACSPQAMQLAAPLLSSMPCGVAVSQAALMSERDWSRSAYYNECIRPMGGFHGVGFRQAAPRMEFYLASCRGRRAGAFDAAALANAQALLPHVALALEWQRRLRTAESAEAGLARLIDRLDAGVIVTDAAGRPLHVNAQAARIAAGNDGLAIDDRRVCAAAAADTRRLDAAIAAATRGPAGERRLRINRPSGRPPLAASLMAMTGLDAPRVAIFIVEPDMPQPIDRAALADIYGLTRRETEIAALVADGRAPAAIAAHLQLGVGTVRNHLKRVFDKTGVSTQAALAARARSLTKRIW